MDINFEHHGLIKSRNGMYYFYTWEQEDLYFEIKVRSDTISIVSYHGRDAGTSRLYLNIRYDLNTKIINWDEYDILNNRVYPDDPFPEEFKKNIQTVLKCSAFM